MTKKTIANCILYPCGTFGLCLILAAKSGLIEFTWKVSIVLFGATAVCVACGFYKEVVAYREKLDEIYE